MLNEVYSKMNEGFETSIHLQITRPWTMDLLANALAERLPQEPLLLFSVPPLFSSHDEQHVEMIRIAMTTLFLIFIR